MGLGNSIPQMSETSGSGDEDSTTMSENQSGSAEGNSQSPRDLQIQAIMAYLIRSGEIRYLRTDHDDDSDDLDIDSDPTLEASGNMSPKGDSTVADNINLKESDLFTSILHSSGQRLLNHGKSGITSTANVLDMVMKREVGSGKQKNFSSGDRCLISSSFLPNQMESVVRYRQKAFCGSFSQDGDTFVSACQDQYIRVYNTAGDSFDLVKSIRARDVGWSILDVAFSPDGRYAAYSSWSDSIHLCNLYGDHEIHEALDLNPGDYSFCIFSLKFSSDNKEILGGANDRHLYVYDREAGRRTLKVFGHDDDINAVCFADQSSQILYSGGDDGLCKVWDRRTLREDHPIPVGVLVGHCDGITYIDSKGDAMFFVSNSKDQSMKLWDVRKCASKADVEKARRVVLSQRWDYRRPRVPRRVTCQRNLAGDTSLMTYRGHSILHTLIRCKFSPMEITGQRYLYTGCSTGAVVVYDVLTGEIVDKLNGHSSCVRDVSWHPYQNIIVSTSWDFSLGRWNYFDKHAHSLAPGEEEMFCEFNTDDRWRRRRRSSSRRSAHLLDLDL